MLRAVLLAGLGVLAFAARAGAQAPADSCQHIVGEWAWFTKADILINADGSLLLKTSAPNGGMTPVGHWTCDAAGRYTLNWTNNAIDTLDLTHSGLVLSGKNQLGFEVTAERILPEPVATPTPSPPAPRPVLQPVDNPCAPGSSGGWRQQCTNELKASPLYGPFPSQGAINSCVQQKMAACGNLMP